MRNSQKIFLYVEVASLVEVTLRIRKNPECTTNLTISHLYKTGAFEPAKTEGGIS